MNITTPGALWLPLALLAFAGASLCYEKIGFPSLTLGVLFRTRAVNGMELLLAHQLQHDSPLMRMRAMLEDI